MTHAMQRMHFIGIGGAGMSAIAELLHHQGCHVAGSDLVASETTRRLQELGVRVHFGHDAAHVGDAQAVVVSTAVAADNPELLSAQARGLPVLPRAAMLAELMRGRVGIAVAGTHGKTTTTSLVAAVLIEAGADPSFVIGGRYAATGAHARLGAGPHIVVEADESDASFLKLDPMLAVITNIDTDHMATYGHELARLHDAFVDFVHRLPLEGRAVLCSDDAGVRAVMSRLQRPTLVYGLGEAATLRAVQVQALAGGRMSFVAQQRGAADLPLTLELAGEHNVRNALAALAVARELGLPDAAAQRAMAGFAGVGRRFERHGELRTADGGRCILVDDYGHHPVELAAVLAAARGAWPGRRLVAAFQPHRYSRTRDCFDGFVDVLRRFDAVWLTAVYAAGEAPLAGADGRALAQALRQAGGFEVAYVDDIDALPDALQAGLRDGDVLITIGAGSIGGVPAQMVGRAGETR